MKRLYAVDLEYKKSGDRWTTLNVTARTAEEAFKRASAIIKKKYSGCRILGVRYVMELED